MLVVSREALKDHPLKHAVKTQTGTPPEKRQTEALVDLLKALKTD
jgi:hypothetical protein